MRRGQVLVEAIRADGKLGVVDALDLNDESFRAFILVFLCRAGILAETDNPTGEEVILRERNLLKRRFRRRLQ